MIWQFPDRTSKHAPLGAGWLACGESRGGKRPILKGSSLYSLFRVSHSAARAAVAMPCRFLQRADSDHAPSAHSLLSSFLSLFRATRSSSIRQPQESPQTRSHCQSVALKLQPNAADWLGALPLLRCTCHPFEATVRHGITVHVRRGDMEMRCSSVRPARIKYPPKPRAVLASLAAAPEAIALIPFLCVLLHFSLARHARQVEAIGILFDAEPIPAYRFSCVCQPALSPEGFSTPQTRHPLPGQ